MIPLELYRRLASLAEDELELVENGRLDDADAVAAERRKLQALLPEQAPAEAREPLEQAARLTRLAIASIRVGLDRARAELAQLHRARPVLEAYVEAPRTHDLDASG